VNSISPGSRSHDVTFDAAALSSGVYLYRLQTDGFSEARVLSLLK
jgi:hypothetical protein